MAKNANILVIQLTPTGASQSMFAHALLHAAKLCIWCASAKQKYIVWVIYWVAAATYEL